MIAFYLKSLVFRPLLFTIACY